MAWAPGVCGRLLMHPTVLSCSLPRPQKHRNIPEESTNKWKQRVKTAMAGVKLVLFYFGGNTGRDCLQTPRAIVSATNSDCSVFVCFYTHIRVSLPSCRTRGAVTCVAMSLHGCMGSRGGEQLCFTWSL